MIFSLYRIICAKIINTYGNKQVPYHGKTLNLMDDSRRHLKRQYLQKVQLPNDVLDVINNAPKTNFSKKQLKAKSQTFLLTQHGECIKGFKHNTIKFPTPNPITVYFDMGLKQLDYLISKKALVLELARKEESIDKILSSLFYYFGTSSIFATQLVCALECLINLNVKNESTYELQKDSKTKTGEDIIWVRTKEKLEFVLPHLTGKKKFNSDFPDDIVQLKKLVDYRNECIHPKRDEEFAMDNFENLFQSCLTFNYEAAINATRNFINYYSEVPIIEECFCYKHQNG